MAYQTVLSIMQKFCRRRSLTVPSAVVTSTDQTITQALELMMEGVEELANMSDWKCMQLQVAPFYHQGQYTTPTSYIALDMSFGMGDFKWIIPGTFWCTSTRLPVAGPLSEAQAQQMQVLQVTPAQYSYWIGQGQSGDALYIYPRAASSVLFQFMYQTTWPWVTVTTTYIPPGPMLTVAPKRPGVPDPNPPGITGGNYTTYAVKQYVTADTDLCLFPDHLVLADLKWRWNYVKGLPYAEDKDAFDRMLANFDSSESPGKILHMDPKWSNESKAIGPGLLIAAGSWPIT
jgi:hypothetical protein